MRLDTLLSENSKNHYKLLVLVGDDSGKKQEVIDFLTNKGWMLYDVDTAFKDFLEEIPKEKMKVRIGGKVKEWIKGLSNRLILTNTSLLYSSQLGLLNPVETFRYAMRGDREAVLFLEGRIREEQLIYSTPDRSDYAEVNLSQVIFFRLDDVLIGSEE